MTKTGLPDLHDRLKASADARKALIARFKPRPACTDPDFELRASRRAAELDRVRGERAAAKALRRQAVEQAGLDVRQAQATAEQAALEAKRSQRKERKALTKVEAKARRDARYAARKARGLATSRGANHAA